MTKRIILHPLLQTIRGMCADERPYGEIDQAVARAVDIAKDLEDHHDPKPFAPEDWTPTEDMPRYDHCQYCGSGRVFVNDEGYCDACERLVPGCDKCGAMVPTSYVPEYGASFCQPCAANPQAKP